MPFDYSATGLPANANWEKAATAYYQWVVDQGFGFNDKQIQRFMDGQPIAAARRMLDNCPDASDESVMLVLFGQIKGEFMRGFAQDPATTNAFRDAYGDRALHTLLSLANPAHAQDDQMRHDVNRIIMVESIAMMEDQLVGREKFPRHDDADSKRMHAVRWEMLKGYEHNLQFFKTEPPALLALYEDTLKQARASIEAVEKKPLTPLPPRRKPPGFAGG